MARIRPWRGLATVVLCMTGVLLVPTTAQATGNCANANPNDQVADDAALQSCIDQGGKLSLDPGSPGYLLATGLHVSRSNTTITTSVPGQAVTLLAAPTLNAPMLTITDSSVYGTTISFLTFDGNRSNRTDVSSCSGDRTNESTIFMTTANAFDFEHNTITHTVCGSAFNVAGTTMTIAYNTLSDNGHGREAVDASEPWSDGMTLAYCAQASVHDNQITDATDVGLVIFDSSNCNVNNNTIRQINRHAFAGLQFGAPKAGTDGFHSGSTIQSNTVVGSGLLSFGIAYGVHPWFASTVHNGSVSANNVSGAIVNLVVDGVQQGQVGMNSLTAPAGTPLCPSSSNAPVNYDLNVLHAIQTTTTMVPDATRSYDGCIP